jgi:gluconate 2-dehydrogenase gamma chain
MAEKDEKEKVFSRRDFLKTSGVATGGIIGGSLLGGLIGFDRGGSSSSSESAPEDTAAENDTDDTEEVDLAAALMFFTRHSDFEILSAATERIFPENETGPGAVALGVPYFIDKQLASSWGKNGEDYRLGTYEYGDGSINQSPLTRGEIFIQALRKMDSISQEEYEEGYADTSEENQDEILKSFEAGDVELKGVESTAVFDFIRTVTVEGVFSDPLYGGNKNMKGWDMIEYPGAIASNTDMIESDEFVNKDPVSLATYQGH